KRLPLSGEDLANYLRNIPAEQIDAIDIITNPGAKYEAEGTAGIIDIKLKRDKSLGSNGSLSTTYGQGRYASGNVSGSLNYRTKALSAFGQAGYGDRQTFTKMAFQSKQNGFATEETMRIDNLNNNYNYRLGTDFFIKKNHTIGFLVTGNNGERQGDALNRVEIATQGGIGIDSILLGNNLTDAENNAATYNLNYVFNAEKTTLNVDLDYGRYRNNSTSMQPNRYLDPAEESILSQVNTSYDTRNDIDIYTFLVDFETELWGGKLGLGTKLSQVGTDNTFLFYDIPGEDLVFNEQRSNIFAYDENVYAGYVNFARGFGEKINVSAGLRLEQTDARGDLQAFDPSLNEPPVENNYLSAFPSGGITYQMGQNTLALNYGRRINRPDYNVLNPFRAQVSELSYFKGNPFLAPEIVNNYELGYTLKYRYNFKLSYSKTIDQITRLISPDDENPLAGFLTWDNLAVQHIYALNVTAPVQVTDKWNAFFSLGASHINNQATYEDGGVVDIQAWTYSIFQQHTFKLPWQLTGEISGWFSGPGVWGGVFLYETSWSLNMGLQRRFLDDQVNVRLSVNDIFYESGWSGTSSFNGLESIGRGNWDSRRASLSVSWNFGNKNVKTRKRNTGLEEEASRVNTDGGQ
ncbi:MAG: outer membrane beta-barrel family protein, partial [Saprospiraceae bacterium]|nr:outer membrane beta-barrel family protein [Saprospiraceae bacterium]